MLVIKSKTLKITCEKDYNGLYSVFQYNKKIFGNGWESKRLLDSLTLKQCKQFKNQVLAKMGV